MKENREIVTVEDALNASGQALVAYYNAHATVPIKRFASRAVAIKRVVNLIRLSPPTTPKATPKVAPAVRPPKTHALSDAQRVAWQDPDVREARCERSAVSVDGEDYKSVRAAFLSLNLPMGKHIKFRGELKEAGKLTAFGHEWEIVPLNY